MRRQRREIERVDCTIASEVSLRPRLAGPAEVRGQGVEIQGIDLAIQIGVAVFGVKDGVNHCVHIGLVDHPIGIQVGAPRVRLPDLLIQSGDVVRIGSKLPIDVGAAKNRVMRFGLRRGCADGFVDRGQKKQIVVVESFRHR